MGGAVIGLGRGCAQLTRGSRPGALFEQECAGAQTAQTFQLTCSLTGGLGDDKTARPGASAKVRVQMETGCIA